MLGALGLLLSSLIKQLENFAGVMNFVIFPMFFASSALYPLWRMKESSLLLYQISAANPFSHAVELVRFAFYGQLDPWSLAATARLDRPFPGRRALRLQPGQGLRRRDRQGGLADAAEAHGWRDFPCPVDKLSARALPYLQKNSRPKRRLM